MRKIRNFKITKGLSWYYIFAFVAIFGLAVYLYQSFKIREGQQTNELKVGDAVKYTNTATGNIMAGTIEQITVEGTEKTYRVLHNNEIDTAATIEKLSVNDRVSNIVGNDRKIGKITGIHLVDDTNVFDIEYVDGTARGKKVSGDGFLFNGLQSPA